MDERFRGKGMWIGAAALAIIFLCVMLCALGAMGTMFARTTVPAVPYVPQASEDGAVSPPVYQGHGPLGMGRLGHSGPFGLFFGAVGALFKLAFLGVLALLFLGLIKRVIWGPRHWHHAYAGKPPTAEEWKTWKQKHHGWGPPWAWHCHGAPWAQEAEAEQAEQSETDTSAYAGPQE
jgi:hypothetical protein